MKAGTRKAMAGMLVVTMTSSVVTPAWAGTIDTESALRSDRERMLVLLDRPDVQAELEARGVRTGDAKARIEALTDAEAAQLAQQIDTAPAGAGGSGIEMIVLLPIYLVVGTVWLVVQLVRLAAR